MEEEFGMDKTQAEIMEIIGEAGELIGEASDVNWGRSRGERRGR